MDMVAEYAQTALQTYPHLAMSVAFLEAGALDKTHYGDLVQPADDTIYEIGELTRVFTGTILTSAIGVDFAGLSTPVELQDPVNKWLQSDVTGSFPDTVTLLSLATHTSGLPDEPSNLPLPLSDPNAPNDNPYGRYSVTNLTDFMRNWTPKPERPPGAFHESNLGYGILGFVLTQIKPGRTYNQMLAEYVTTPLGMADTFVSPTPAQQQRMDAFELHLGNDRKPIPGEPGELEAPEVPFLQWGGSPLVGAEALKSTLTDLVKWLEANLAAEGAPAYDGKVLLHATP